MPNKHTPLRRAIFESGRRQIEIARDAKIHYSTLSLVANGYRQATDDEQAALARVLRKKKAELFPPNEAQA
jgi:hypothetical protein